MGSINAPNQTYILPHICSSNSKVKKGNLLVLLTMKATFFSDLHGKLDTLESIKGKNNLFFIGDLFTSMRYVELLGQETLYYYYKIISPEQFYQKFKAVKEELAQIKPSHPVPDFFKENKMFVIPGNHDIMPFYEKMMALPNLHNLHLKKEMINEVEFVGHGGMFVPNSDMNFPHFFMYSDKKIAENLKAMKPSKGCVIIMHELPIKDYCTETRKVIEKIKPQVVIGGHDHSLAKVDVIMNGVRYICSGVRGELLNLNITSD